MNFLRLGHYFCTKNDLCVWFLDYLDCDHKYRRTQGLNYKFQGPRCKSDPMLMDDGLISKKGRGTLAKSGGRRGMHRPGLSDLKWATQISPAHSCNGTRSQPSIPRLTAQIKWRRSQNRRPRLLLSTWYDWSNPHHWPRIQRTCDNLPSPDHEPCGAAPYTWRRSWPPPLCCPKYDWPGSTHKKYGASDVWSLHRLFGSQRATTTVICGRRRKHDSGDQFGVTRSTIRPTEPSNRIYAIRRMQEWIPYLIMR
jgi:hypothetical protein